MRSPAEMDVVQIDIGTKCHLKCSNCAQLMHHRPAHTEMPLETFERAVASMKGWEAPDRIIGVTAGEPTLHSDFERISMRFAELWGGPLTGNGTLPLKDFNQFAAERLADRSTGRGLGTTLGPGFHRHYETIMEVYGHWNTNTHESGSRHKPVLITRDDYKRVTGTSDDQWLQNRDACQTQNKWFPAINDKGAYFCEVAASIDLLYFEGKHAWPVETGWWQRKPADFGNQLDLCNHCGLAQPLAAQLDLVDRDIISEQSRDRLAEIGSPSVKAGRYQLFDAPKPEIPDAGNGRLVGIGNRATKTRKLSGVVVSVNYAHDLAATLPQNIGLFDEFVVVTTEEDGETQKVARQAGAKLVISNRCFEDDHIFNKGRMLNDGLAALDDPDWIILTDADITLNPATRDYAFAHALNPGCLYFTARQNAGSSQIERVDMEPNGYFQMFNPLAKVIRERGPKPMCEEFCSAGGIDSWFWQQWSRERVIFVPDFHCINRPSTSVGQNWNGKQPVKTAKWRQFGFLTIRGFSAIVQADAVPTVIKLTDTKYGQSKVIESKDLDSYVRIVPTGLEFLGRELGGCHIHVAYKN